MDGSQSTPRNNVLVEVQEAKLLHLEKPGTGERRAARSGNLLLGHAAMIGPESWILFEDGFGIRTHRLKTAWDNLIVEASKWDGNEKAGELFDE